MSFFKLTRNSTINWKRFFVRLFRLNLSLCVGLITLVALAWVIENWRGARALERELASLKAKGEPVDLNDFQHPQIPDEQNLAMIPLFRDYVPYKLKDGPQYWKLKISEDQILLPEFMTIGHSSFFRAELVTHEHTVSYFEKLIEEAHASGVILPFDTIQSGVSDVDWLLGVLDYYRPIREAIEKELTTRPYFALPKKQKEPQETKFHTYAKFKAINLHFASLAALSLEKGDVDAAFYWVVKANDLSLSLEKDPFALGRLVRLACHGVALNPVWQGLFQHRWKEKHLDYFQSYYGKLDCLKPLVEVEQSERAGKLDWCLKGQRKSPSENIESNFYTSEQVKKVRWIPSGWHKMLGVQYSRIIQIQIDGLRQSHPFDPAVYVQAFKQCEGWMASSMAIRMLGANPLITTHGSWRLQQRWVTQTHFSMVPIVCALERYRLTNQQYPETLQELEPTYIETLPKDPILGGDFKYHLTDDGDFRLYSIGWNAKDDGGIPYQTVTENRITRYQYDQNDWVWPWPGMLR
jgi:hypothetical protein